MKNSIVISVIIILSTSGLFAQPAWQWGQEVGISAKNIAIDQFGNSYVTWALQNSHTIDGEVFTSNGSNDAALTSFDCDGAHRWTKIIGGSSVDQALGLGTDTLGGVYVNCLVNGARQENHSVYIVNDTTIISDRKSMLLLKYDTEGNLQWLRMPEDTVVFNLPDELQIGAGLDLDVAPNGDCYVYSRLFPGTYGNGAYEATYETTLEEGGEDIYALKYDRYGTCTGGLHFDIYYTGSVLKYLEFTYNNNKFYASGYSFTETNTLILDETTIIGRKGYLASFDNSGNINWVKTGNDTIVNNLVIAAGFDGKLAFDQSGMIYAAGFAGGSGAGFGDFTFVNPLGDITGFPILFKFSPTGELVDATSGAANALTLLNAVAVSDSTVVVAGNYGNNLVWGDSISENNSMIYDVFLARFNTNSFNQPIGIEPLQSSSSSSESASQLIADDQGNFYVGGKFSGQLYVGDGTLYNQSGQSEGFIAKFGSDSCYCPPPEALFAYDSIPGEAGFNFAYTGSADVDSVTWTFGDGQTATGTSPYHLYAQAGEYTVCATAFNTCGTDTVCMTIDANGPVGIETVKGFEDIRVYPNPAQAYLTIANAPPGTGVAILNAIGQQWQSTTIQSGEPTRMNVDELPPGIYLLRLSDAFGKEGYARFVKE